jgi:hypothetical protein
LDATRFVGHDDHNSSLLIQQEGMHHESIGQKQPFVEKLIEIIGLSKGSPDFSADLLQA